MTALVFTCVSAASSLASAEVVAPPGWKSAPELVAAAALAMRSDSVKLVASHGYSAPALGCYAVWLQLAGPAMRIDRAAQQLVASIKSAGIAVRDVIAPTTSPRGVVALQFAQAPYQGVVRAALTETGELEAVACAWNDREPTLCEASCAKFMAAVQ